MFSLRFAYGIYTKFTHVILCLGGCTIQPSLTYRSVQKNRTQKRARAVTRALRLPIILCLAVLLLAFPTVSADGVRTGLALCAHAVIPALFPFTVLSPLLADAMHDVFPSVGAKGSIALSLALGMLTGFPIGALSVISAYEKGEISKNTAESFIGIASGTGPAFLVGYVGLGLFGSSAFGWTLVLLQCASSLLLALFFRTKITAPPTAVIQASAKHHPAASLFSEIGGAAAKMVSICAFIVFFSVIRAFVAYFVSLGAIPQSIALLLGGILEMTGGIADIAAVSGTAASILSAFFVGFGGICVLGQVGLFAKKAGLSLRQYLLQKCLCGGFCAVGMILLSAI